jgi:hypothetical protein
LPHIFTENGDFLSVTVQNRKTGCHLVHKDNELYKEPYNLSLRKERIGIRIFAHIHTCAKYNGKCKKKQVFSAKVMIFA